MPGAWGAYRAARENALALIPEAAYHEPTLRGGRARRGWLMVSDPHWVEHVLKRQEPNYPKSDIILRMLRPTRGQSIFTASGRRWRWQHRAMVPVFQHRNLEALSPAMTLAAEAASTRLARAADLDSVTDVHPEMVVTALDAICEAVLSGGENLDRAGLSEAVSGYIETVARVSLLDLLGAPGWVPRPARLLDRYAPRMDRIIDAVIARRLNNSVGGRQDLLDLMIDATDPKRGRAMTRTELRNNLLIMIVAGHETTALALSWALYLLAFDRTAQFRARTEAQEVLGQRAATAEDVPRMPFVTQVLNEALRLYPPAGLLTRQAREPDRIDGQHVGPGTLVTLPLYAMHRHRALWRDPDAFDPDRFGPGGDAPSHRYAFLPFGGGPRICIGMGFAMMEAQIVLSTLLARFDFSLVPETRPEPQLILTLRPAGGVPLRIKRL